MCCTGWPRLTRRPEIRHPTSLTEKLSIGVFYQSLSNGHLIRIKARGEDSRARHPKKREYILRLPT